MMKFGYHMSIRNGYLGAAKTAVAIGAKAFQYFPKNPRSLAVKSFDRHDASACKEYCEQHQLQSIAHTPYPTNLSIDDPSLYQATAESVRNDLEIAETCGSIGVVVHFGQYKGWEDNPLHGYQKMIQMLNDILADWKGSALILLENNAGQRGRMGTTLEELTQVRNLVTFPEKIGFCFDTCHAFASGIWRGNDWETVAEKARELIYFPHLRAVHLNDSVYPSLSYRDRHAIIGKGEIGEKPFREFLQTPELADLPIVLETPAPLSGSYQEELAFLQKLAAD